MLPIQRKISPYNHYKLTNKKNQFIVIHYVGSTSTAANNANYFYGGNRDASANYFVDEISIWQSVEDYNGAWHCGGGLQGNNWHKYFGTCTNSNSIGIEMCCKKDSSGNWYFEDATVQNTIDLTKMLMTKYNIDLDHVIRHADVTGKVCPEPYCRRESDWLDFKARLTGASTTVETNKVDYQVEVTADVLNCRAGYSTAYSIITTYTKGTKLNISEEYNGWGYTGTGWISLSYTKKITVVPTEPIVENKKEEEEIVTQEQFNEMMNVWIADSANKQPGDWSAEARNWAESNGLIQGDEQGRMMYKKNLTREEFVTVLSRLFDVDDSQVGDWSAEARNWAESAQLVVGDGNKKGWMDFVTKEQLVTILYRFKELIKNEK